MLNLKIAGALEEAKTFPKPLSPIRVARIGILDENRRIHARHNITSMKEAGENKALIFVLKMVAVNSVWLEMLKNKLRGYPQVFQFLKKVKNRIFNIANIQP